jgi:putative membrane protein
MNPTSAGDLPTATKLSVDRTRLAHERTLMAWVRTATSLISFGFTIYKFFQYREQGDRQAVETMIGPRGLALILIGIGLTGLVLATLDHRRSMVILRSEYGQLVPYSLGTLIAGFVGLLGILGLLAVVFRQ